jgi:hypothetical protein
MALVAIVNCQEFDEFDEQIFQELEEQQQAKMIIDGMPKLSDKQFDGKFNFCNTLL